MGISGVGGSTPYLPPQQPSSIPQWQLDLDAYSLMIGITIDHPTVKNAQAVIDCLEKLKKDNDPAQSQITEGDIDGAITQLHNAIENQGGGIQLTCMFLQGTFPPFPPAPPITPPE